MFENRAKEKLDKQIERKVQTEGYVKSEIGFIEYGTKQLSLQDLARKVLELETIINKLRSRLGI